MSLEAVDRQILQLLAEQGRLSYTDLARLTGLSTSAVHQRVRRLEQKGIVRGYRAEIDPTAAGVPLTAFVAVMPLDPAQPDDTPERLREVTEIEACHSVAGDYSYLLKVRVAGPSDLEALLARIRALANVSTRTTVVLSTAYEGRPPSL